MSPDTQLWLALSRAFLPPTNREVAAAFLESLPGELETLCEACGVEALAEIGALAESLDLIGDPEALLVHYSGLFLPPSARVSLNLATRLDGSLNGAAMDAIETAMARHGVAKAESFRDLPDHLAVLLEVLALLSAEKVSAEETAAFAGAFLLPALPRLSADIAAHAPDSPYRHLVNLTLAVLASHGLSRKNDAPGKPRYDKSLERGVWRHCNQCGKPFARAKELLIMARALQDNGLPTDHLQTCPDCRAGILGGSARPLPPLKGGRSEAKSPLPGSNACGKAV